MNKFKIIAASILSIALLGAVEVLTPKPFVVLNNHKQKIQKDTLARLEAVQTQATVSGNSLVFSDSVVQLVVRTGSPEDMISYRIQGLRNPTIILRAGTMVHLLFANVDDDMDHDFRIGTGTPPIRVGSIGTDRLSPSEGASFSAESLTLRAQKPGTYYYFCNVSNHAREGMRGKLIVAASGMPVEAMMKLSPALRATPPNQAATKSAQGVGTGTIRAIDVQKQTITLDHGKVPGIMPAMTMAYKVADPKFLHSVTINESVRFTLTKSANGEFLITNISRQ